MTAGAPATVGLAVIARDEEQMLPGLLDSVSGCFDQVVLLDTGSTDGTVPAFETWARRESARHPGFESVIDSCAWQDDFAAARNRADALLTTDWRVWADADDEVRGASHLRRLAGLAPEEIVAFVAGYEYAHSASGEVLTYLQRIRMVRSGKGRWRDPVHEQIDYEGELAGIAPTTTVWVHRKADKVEVPDRPRNLRIVLDWLEREPDNLRALDFAGREEAARGNHERAVEHFRRYVALDPPWDERTAQVHRHYALSLIALGELDAAAADAAMATAAMPDWPDGYLTLAELAIARGDTAAAVDHARRVIDMGPPTTALPLVLTDYTAHPRLLIARALRQSGDADEARRAAVDALAAVAGTHDR
jgi:tetratricopeptide (TPR) repeat protein